MDIYEIRKRVLMGESIYNIPLRVTYYARVSTIHFEQASSLENQKNYFQDMIENNKNWTYIPGYIDKGISGTTDIKRENFMRMINDAESHIFDLIITKEISRFSRNTLDSIHYTRKLLEWGIPVLFLNDNINTALPDSELRLTIMSSLAQDEIRRLSERVKFGMHESIKNGTILGNNMLYGYYKDKTTGYLKIIKKEATIVKRIYNLYTIENYSLNKIATIFNNENIPTKTDKKWNVTTLKRILTNPKYAGYYCGGKSERIDYISKKIHYIPSTKWYMYKDTKKIPPIIKRTLWNKTQEKVKNKDYHINKKTYSFSNKIYCEYDKILYYPRRQCHNDITWLCSNYLKNKKDSCSSANIRNSELFHIFKDLLDYIHIDISKIKSLIINIYNRDIKITDFLIYNKLIEELILKITVNNCEVINTTWYLKNTNIINFTKSYEFKRGYDKVSTKRYTIKYNAHFLSISSVN